VWPCELGPLGTLNKNKVANENVNVVVNDVDGNQKDGVNEEIPIVEDNIGDLENPLVVVDELYVSDNNISYKVLSEGDSSNSEYNPFSDIQI